MIWGNQFLTPPFAQPTLENSKVLNFSRDIRFGEVPATVVFQTGWLTPGESHGPTYGRDGGDIGAPRPTTPQAGRRHTKAVECLRNAGFPCPSLPGAPAYGLQIPATFDRVAQDACEVPINRDHPACGTVHGLAGATTVEPLQGISSLASVDLVDSTLV